MIQPLHLAEIIDTGHPPDPNIRVMINPYVFRTIEGGLLIINDHEIGRLQTTGIWRRLGAD